MRITPDFGEIRQFLAESADVWNHEKIDEILSGYNKGSMKYIRVKNGLLESTQAAALLLMEFDTEALTWRAAALGDTLLFKVDGDANLTADRPYAHMTGDTFGNNPMLVTTSISEQEKIIWNSPHFVAEEAYSDGAIQLNQDHFFLMTDAIASYYLYFLETYNDVKHDPSQEMLTIYSMLLAGGNHEMFHQFVDLKRTRESARGFDKLKNDDVTLMRLKFTNVIGRAQAYEAVAIPPLIEPVEDQGPAAPINAPPVETAPAAPVDVSAAYQTGGGKKAERTRRAPTRDQDSDVSDVDASASQPSEKYAFSAPPPAMQTPSSDIPPAPMDLPEEPAALDDMEESDAFQDVNDISYVTRPQADPTMPSRPDVRSAYQGRSPNDVPPNPKWERSRPPAPTDASTLADEFGGLQGDPAFKEPPKDQLSMDVNRHVAPDFGGRTPPTAKSDVDKMLQEREQRHQRKQQKMQVQRQASSVPTQPAPSGWQLFEVHPQSKLSPHNDEINRLFKVIDEWDQLQGKSEFLADETRRQIVVVWKQFNRAAKDAWRESIVKSELAKPDARWESAIRKNIIQLFDDLDQYPRRTESSLYGLRLYQLTWIGYQLMAGKLTPPPKTYLGTNDDEITRQDELKQLLQSFKRIRDEIRSYNGTIPKWIGDFWNQVFEYVYDKKDRFAAMQEIQRSL